MSLAEQMAHIGSEVLRALAWRQKGNERYSGMALDRALELLDLTIKDYRHRTRLKELCRLREVICDYFLGDNEYQSTDALWKSYFYPFNWSARKNF